MKPSTYLQLLSLIFIACKLTGSIDWSWWLVLAPVWGWHLFAFTVGVISGVRNARERSELEQRAAAQKGKGIPEVENVH